MALTPEEKARKAELDKELINSGARMDPAARQELTQLNDKARGTFSEGLAEMSDSVSGGLKSFKGWLDKTSKAMEYKPESKLPSSATLDTMFGGAPSLSPIGPTAKAELEKNAPPAAVAPLSAEAQAAADKVKKDEEDKLKKSKEFDPKSIVGAMDSLAKQMASIPEGLKKEFDKPMAQINSALADFNNQYQADQAAAKDKTEKAKNRAEWASIASMLAKNVVGYAAALNGVDPNAMAYQTTDWEKHIQGLNAELDMNLGHIRENMKMKVEGKLGEKKDLQGQMDDTFKTKMEALRAKMEGKKAEFQAGLQMSEAEKDRLDKAARAAEEAKQKAREAEIGRTTIKPESVAAAKTALSKAEKLDDVANIAASFGVPIEEINAAKAEADRTWPKSNDITGFKAKMSAALDARAISNPVRTTTSRLGAGQSGAPMVQSPKPITTEAEYNALPSGAKFSWNGQVGIKP